MGLLDDAIREHLELKRLRGADPGLVAREEHTAFGPVRGDGNGGVDDDGATPGDLVGEGSSPTRDGPVQTSQPDSARDFSNVGQETAELDMRTVLDDEPGHDHAPSEPGVGDGPSTGGAHTEQRAADDALEWEMPGDGASDNPAEHPEDDQPANVQDAYDDAAADQPDESVEDVLEETPDFLRDTPEQERLWFEQRPPRDFDFDK